MWEHVLTLQVDSLTEERDSLIFKVRELESAITQLKAKDGEIVLDFLDKIPTVCNFMRADIIIYLHILLHDEIVAF